MTPVDWSNVFKTEHNAKTLYSRLTTPRYVSRIESEVAAFRLANDICIDIQWRIDPDRFVVNLFHDPLTIDSLDNMIHSRECESVEKVLDAVKDFSDKAIEIGIGKQYTQKSASESVHVIWDRKPNPNSFESIPEIHSSFCFPCVS